MCFPYLNIGKKSNYDHIRSSVFSCGEIWIVNGKENVEHFGKGLSKGKVECKPLRLKLKNGVPALDVRKINTFVSCLITMGSGEN